MPLLVRKDYVNKLKSSIWDSMDDKLNNVTSPIVEEMTEIQKEDFGFLQQNLQQLESFSSKATFLLKYLGQMALKRFVDVAFHCGSDGTDGKSFGDTLATNLQLFWNSSLYRKRAEQVTAVLLSCCKTEKQLEQGIERCIIIGKNELATYFLLNNDYQHKPNATDFRLNALRACLLSANLRSEESQCLVKLTATNLIASNFITDGIQLLFLIDQGLDACKYLISQGLWAQSVAYSKMHPNCDFDEILLRYVDHLLNDQSYKTLAILILASLRKWDKCGALVDSSADTTMSELLKSVISRAAEPRETAQPIDIANNPAQAESAEVY